MILKVNFVFGYLVEHNVILWWLGTLKIVVGPNIYNPTKPACEVRIAPTYKHIVSPSPFQCRNLNTTPHDQHY